MITRDDAGVMVAANASWKNDPNYPRPVPSAVRGILVPTDDADRADSHGIHSVNSYAILTDLSAVLELSSPVVYYITQIPSISIVYVQRSLQSP